MPLIGPTGAAPTIEVGRGHVSRQGLQRGSARQRLENHLGPWVVVSHTLDHDRRYDLKAVLVGGADECSCLVVFPDIHPTRRGPGSGALRTAAVHSRGTRHANR